MLDQKVRDRIEQERINCLCAEFLHIASLEKLGFRILLVDALALIVPVLYFPLRYFSKDTTYSMAVEVSWEFLAACLIGAAIWKFVAGWQERYKNHGRLMGENVALVRQAVDLLNDENSTPQSAQGFLALAERSEKADRELLGTPMDKERQPAYRQALKEVGPVSVICPVCNSSPWRFTAGSCQLCGNTPTGSQST